MGLLTCWTTNDLATQPRIVRRGRSLAAQVVIGVWSAVAHAPVSVTVDAQRWDGNAWTDLVSATAAEPVTIHTLDRRRRTLQGDAKRLDFDCRVQELRDAMAANPDNRFFELELPPVAPGTLVQFRATAEATGTAQRASCDARGLRLLAPEFDATHLVRSHTDIDDDAPLTDDQWWVLLCRQPSADCPAWFDLRLDLLTAHAPDDPAGLPPVTFRVEGSAYSLCQPKARVWDDPAGVTDVWPLLDPSTGSVLVAVPCLADGAPPALRITVGDSARSVARGSSTKQQVIDTDVTLDASAAFEEYSYRPVPLILIHYAIQGFNDLFSEPTTAYDPPRNYIQVTFEDEKGRFCSRPGRTENGVPDGYVYALRAQAAYKVKTQWAVNAGLLMLLKDGLAPVQFDEFSQQVRDGLVSVSNAGFSAHRPPYYTAVANTYELQYGTEAIKGVLGVDYDGVYYPDQRIYLASTAEIEAYDGQRVENGLKYLVLDRSTVATKLVIGTFSKQICLFGEGSGTGDDGNYIWKESATGLLLLLIEDQFRDQLLGATTEEQVRGQLTLELRRRFMKAVRFAANGPSKVYVYGDDLDHSCGDGWFDGSSIPYTENYLAALRWMSHHPWVYPTTVSDPQFSVQQHIQDLPLTVSSAICPSVDPGGAETYDHAGNEIHFDTWYDWWANYEAEWLGVTLESLSRRLEHALVDWPAWYRSTGLYRLAWMYFLACTHESMWNTQDLGSDPNDDPSPYHRPEDFVISESLQMRHGWVYLNATVWAALAISSKLDNATYVIAQPADDRLGGRLLAHLRRARSADPYWLADAAPPEDQGCYWDQDLLGTIVLYNEHVLLVIDRNGGRITNIFARAGADAISVSGTLKSPQFLSFLGAGAVGCDGSRLQNTVFTPNHAYVATDVNEAAATIGTVQQDGTSIVSLYPDNFNSYLCTVEAADRSVVCTYPAAGSGDEVYPFDSAKFNSACEADRIERQGNGPGLIYPIARHPDGFTKTITLTDREISVRHDGVLPGHVVSNEFCVDQLTALMTHTPQSTQAGANRITLTRGAAGVTVLIDYNCSFVPAVREPTGSDRSAALVAYGELHRVLTDDLRIVCEAGGAFGYRIRISTA